MKRREFITLLGAVSVVWPLPGYAQQSVMPVIGYLSSGSQFARAAAAPAFRRGLNEVGYVEDQNVTIEYRWAEGQYDRLAALAADLVRRQVAVITVFGGVHTVLRSSPRVIRRLKKISSAFRRDSLVFLQ